MAGLRGTDARSGRAAPLVGRPSSRRVSRQPAGSDIDAFHQKANVLLGLYQQTPPGEDRDRILSMYLAFLQSVSAEHQNPAEWLWQVKLLAISAGPDAPKMAQEFQASGTWD